MFAGAKRLVIGAFVLLSLTCDDESIDCREPVTRRCMWNEATQQFDRDCVQLCSGAGSIDAGRD